MDLIALFSHPNKPSTPTAAARNDVAALVFSDSPDMSADYDPQSEAARR